MKKVNEIQVLGFVAMYIIFFKIPIAFSKGSKSIYMIFFVLLIFGDIFFVISEKSFNKNFQSPDSKTLNKIYKLTEVWYLFGLPGYEPK